MPRLCERPGCSAPATVAYGFDTADLMVWLSPFEPEEKARPYGTGILCRRHADALAVPRGWHVDDRREAVPRLFKTVAVGEPSEPVNANVRPFREKQPREKVTREKVAPAAELFDAAEGEPVLDETQAMPWSPKLIEDVVEGAVESEPSRGGLLARAFGNKDRRERD
ncbi:MAG: DUF3499 family protein [Actinomycetota bacterium]